MRLPLSSSYPPIHHPSSIIHHPSTLPLPLLSLSIFISQNPNSQIMASKALPQALITMPRNPTHHPPVMLGFSASFSRRSSSNSARVSLSRVSSSSFGSSFCPIVAAMSRLDFVVRADSSTEGEAEAVGSEEASEAIVEAEAGPVVESEPEEPKTPRKSRVKLGDIMGILNKRAVEAAVQERPVPDIRTGDVVQIKLEVPENKRRLSVYKGIVISRQNAGIHTTIRIRRIIAGIGVEIVFPLYSPNIKELKVLSHRKVRRARLYYLRDKLPRFSTFK
ncbi:PREDICTED: 50S ribosomal protein L19-2, chloroplastic [Prunus mume]|uniref:50S ribosomal protein L19-2, chloroplastic n=1 Tax=Prunus mume TaxID=102107 RepID=A0ABM0PEA3_PRUMU|nr:PREDICTED: 50S ribosomal protein L19-2, chloroplastic [Prunus mume]